MALKKRGLQAFQRSLPQALDKGAEDTARQVLQIRNGLVPVDTGALLESGEALAGPTQGHWIVREGAGLPDARARWTEWGTATQIAQPHLTPAAEQGRALLRRNVAARVTALAGKTRP